jgi:multiple sugar transport system permease protein
LAVALAFFRYDAVAPPTWVGLFNFRQILTNPTEALFQVALWNSLYFAALAVPLRGVSATLLALWLNRPSRGVGVYRAIVYLPTIIPDVAYAMVALWLFNPLYGPINGVLHMLGLPAPGWLADAGLAKSVFVVMALFQIGEGLVVVLAGLQNIPPEYFAAAEVDGATRWQVARYITLPLLAPWLFLLTIRDLILSFQSVFTPSLIMTRGDPYYATLFLPLLIYEEAFDKLRFGPAAAMWVLMFAVTAALVGMALSLVGEREITHD